MWICEKSEDRRLSVKGHEQFISLAGLSSLDSLAMLIQGHHAEEWAWTKEPVSKYYQDNAYSHPSCCPTGSKYLEETEDKHAQNSTTGWPKTFSKQLSEIGNKERAKIDTFYAWCFCFPLFTKWRDCSSRTQRSTKGHQRKMKLDRRHRTASFPELITEGRPFLCTVLLFMSLPLFIFTAACTFWASHLLFAWLRFCFPIRCFADSCRYSSKGEHSLERNHAPQNQAPDHIWHMCRRKSFPFLISDPVVLLWEFMFGLISNLHTFPRKTQQEICLQKPKCIVRQGQTWCIKYDLAGS